jgi:hypothetical protein
MSEFPSHQHWTSSLTALIQSATAPVKPLPAAPPTAAQRTLFLLVTVLMLLGLTPLLVGWIAGQLLR